MRSDSASIFTNIVKNRRHADGVWTEELSNELKLEEATASDRLVKEQIRVMVGKRPEWQRISLISDVTAGLHDEAVRRIDAGEVGAVDGTYAYEPIDLMNFSTLGVATTWVTALNQADPNITIAYTSSAYRDPQSLSTSSALIDLCNELDEAREERSWHRTYREYAERETAMSCPAGCVLIDGPIFTQNLATQDMGRSILDAMADMNKDWVGVIKDLRGAQSLTKWIAYSLLPGEMCTVDTVSESLAERFGVNSGDAGKWASAIDDAFVRVVYRPNKKAFAIECRRDFVPMAMAIIMADSSSTIGHEMPVLMNIADAKMRRFESSAIRQNLMRRIADTDYCMGMDIVDERNYR